MSDDDSSYQDSAGTVAQCRRSSLRPTLPTVHSGVAIDNMGFHSDERLHVPQQQRRSSLVHPTLVSIPSGAVLEHHSFERSDNSEEPSTFARIETAVRNSVRASKRSISSGFRRFIGTRRESAVTDAFPRIENYQNFANASMRPTLDELHEPNDAHKGNNEKGAPKAEEEPVRDKFGWIEGVLIRNMLSIWGVMLFLRISWVVALSGIWQTLIIIAISTFITLMTALSMSAIATNGEIGGGGTYYVMSRILGPEFGGSIGIIFAIANAINASLNVVGFCQSIQDLLRNYGGYYIVDGGNNDIRIIGTVTMIAVCALCGLGAKYEAKTQGVMLVILLVALSNFVVGSILGPRDSEEKQARGFLGYDLDVLTENWSSGYTITEGQMQDFFSVFSVYFPAGIGILAGANVSGDLKDPNSAIPKGTILAIVITSISYAVVAIICGATMKRAATGSVEDLRNGTHLDCASHNCTYGIYYDYQAMTLISGFGPLNYAGCFAATLSSALASYVSCPKLLQVIADDNLYPYWLVGVLGKGYGKTKEPLRAYAFTFVLALVFVLIAQLDVIALLISNFFLATFALLNYSTFHVSLVKPIGWRPTFKYYNMWLSLLTAGLCVVGMFLISWPVALITIAIVRFFYLVVLYRKPEVNWGSSTQAQTYREALSRIQQLQQVEEHVKNYRPQVLALAGQPHARPALVDFAYLICKRNSLLVCGNVVSERLSSKGRHCLLKSANSYLRAHKIKGFCSLMDGASFQLGVSGMLQVAGIGKMKPNILLVGFKTDWRTCDKQSLDQYFAAIHTGFDLQVAVAILRTAEGLDYTGVLGDIGQHLPAADGLAGLDVLHRSPSTASACSTDCPESPPGTPGAERNAGMAAKGKSRKRMKQESSLWKDPDGNQLPKHIVNNMTVFRKKQKRGTIDVWWLYDDGGLTLLLPHIISTRSHWSSCRMRVFCATAAAGADVESERQGMSALLAKFRITCSSVTVIKDLAGPPKESTRAWFDGLLRHFGRRDELTDNERLALSAKTNRQLRLRELLVEHSSDSNLIVMTLPMPRKGSVGAPMYMAWLEALTADMPPFLLVRGNQSSVLTFYS